MLFVPVVTSIHGREKFTITLVVTIMIVITGVTVNGRTEKVLYPGTNRSTEHDENYDQVSE